MGTAKRTTETTGSAPATISRRFGIVAFAVLAAFLCSGSTSPAGCNSQPQGDPFKGEIIGAAVGIGAVIAVVVVVSVNHSHHTMKGCIFEGASGLELRTSDSKTYALEGDPASIKVGDMVKFHGSKVKKTKDSTGDQVFKVERLKKDYGPCRVDSAPTTSAAAASSTR